MSHADLWLLWQHTGYVVRGTVLLCFINFVATLFCHLDNLKHSSGVDRITWILAVWIPFLGPITYLAIGVPERERKMLDEPGQPNDWRASLR